MKKLLTILFLLICNYSFALRSWCFSSTGNDATGLGTRAAPYQTIAKLNGIFSSIAAGDSILFNKGDSFSGTIYCSRSGAVGNAIYIGAYGIGAKPIINGFTTLTSWSLVSGNIYQASVTATNRLNMVTLNEVPQQVGRTPNGNTYLTYKTYVDSTKVTQISLFGTNWTGAEVVMKKNGFLSERCIITAQVDSQITYRAIATINPRQSAYSLSTGKAAQTTPSHAGFGLYIQRDVRTLDVLGEWYYDTTAHLLKMHFGGGVPASYTIKASVRDTLININNKNYITIDGLDLEGGNLFGVYYQDNRNVVVKNCILNNIGCRGIMGWNSIYPYVNNNTFNNCMSLAIDHTSRHQSGADFSDNVVDSVALYNGMACWGDNNDAQGIYITVDSFARISHNYVTNMGYEGISFGGNKVNVDSNYVNNYCFMKDDGGGIYTYGNGSTLSYGRNVRYNIIRNAIGSTAGNGNPTHAEGVYTDGGLPSNSSSGAAGIFVAYNSFENIYGRALYHNDSKYISDLYNTVYNSEPFSISRHSQDSIKNYVLKQNIFFKSIYPNSPPANNQVHFNESLANTHVPVVSTIQQSLQQLGILDSNYYQFNTGNNTPFMWYYANTAGGAWIFPAPVSYATWQSYTGNDAHSPLFSNASIASQRFDYNASDVATVVAFTGLRYTDVYGTIYDNTATIPAWSSRVLILVGSVPSTNVLPVVNSGVDKIITSPTSSVAVTGTATDSDGTIASVTWSKVSGPLGEVIINGNTLNATLSSLVVGFYSFKLQATDNSGGISYDTMTVTVNPAPVNVKPVANAGIDKSIIAPANSVSVTGTATDADGSISSTNWRQVSGPSIATFTTPNLLTTTIGNLIVGAYSIAFKAIDNSGDSSVDFMQITVSAANLPPTITFITPSTTITLPTAAVTVSVVAADVDGVITNYLWTKISGPVGDIIAIPNASSTLISGLTQGTYTFRVLITDNSSGQVSGQVQVIVNPPVPPPNIPPTVTIIGGNQTIVSPASSVTLTSIPLDSDGTIFSIGWSKISGGSATITTPTQASTGVNNLTVGVYQFKVKVIDNSGDSAVATIQVTVTAANIPPVVTITPVPTITLPMNIAHLTAIASDVDGFIQSYSWRKISGPSGGTIVTPSASGTDIISLTEGAYSYSVTAIDNNGDSAVAVVSVTVLPEPFNEPPIAFAGGNQVVLLPTTSTTLSGYGTDTNGGYIFSYRWEFVSTTSAGTPIITTPTSGITGVTNLSYLGDYIFKLTVVDNQGKSSSAFVTITVVSVTPSGTIISGKTKYIQ